ncbi:TIGR04290 family methyltransferase [Azospirillum thermophilum]|uniref:TIGR04290 family methyltransferase n=1 Tax=Azospirillum thermophilum TaxID=2202148 RepID=A0A2S2CVD6_9PROT|nr:TIGR04290 family methyltransferase [Azospirillum thermophilum]AWK88340.1 TIGR04290 family methyltransferase [Azospirillum thermophilum]
MDVPLKDPTPGQPRPEGKSPAGKTSRRDIDALGHWFHNLHLPDGRQTCPDHHFGDFPGWKWRQFRDRIPEDLSGWTALDIGCNAGFYSLELAKRGARVTAIDMNSMYLDQARWAAGQFGLEDRIRFRQCQVYDLARWTERFDLVLFMGVFYHLRYPLLGLDLVAEKVGRMLVFQSLRMPGEAVSQASRGDTDFQNMDLIGQPGWPRLSFIEGSFCKDHTNWWIPDHAAVLAMLRSAGMTPTVQAAPDIYLCEPDRVTPRSTLLGEELRAATGRSAP